MTDSSMEDHPTHRGSAIVALFDHTLTTALIAFSPTDRVWKFCGGTVAVCDTGKNRDEIARSCAYRELFLESGVPKNEVQVMIQVGRPRTWKKQGETPEARTNVFQYTFLGIAEPGVVLPDHVEEEDEMTQRMFIGIKEPLVRALLPRDHPDKFNPYHGIALARSLLLIRDMTADDPSFASFRSSLAALRSSGIHIETYPDELRDGIRQRRL